MVEITQPRSADSSAGAVPEQLAKTERVYRHLREDIENGTFTPGQALPEAMLVEHTGASRTPVREALRRLAVDQLVEIEPRRAPTVTRLSLRSARALFDYRRILEPAAMKAIAARQVKDPALSVRFLDLEAAFAELVDEPYSPEFAARFAELTRKFDDTVVSLTSNDYLARAITELRPHASRLRRIAHADVGRLAESVREHIEMCRAIAQGDGDKAAAACMNHLFHVDQAIFTALLDSTRPDAMVDIDG
ncbi:GntR family transcriptional regulator [Pseudoclavibacter sp. RFBG4]|uniref:GntR family transcriptional regulator n=1 Tax=Pseudoclavibacter sp. RFBG4 TaxID=2080575 RepID=UPI000CE78360|nr:GntR family transcriptional regulator [Pseudoclavibacter sp. RFBG4]PPG26796.1 GntR family transcriptional regulator [Pseudoclavibacter sp. RFBG4]